jgi:hypothetical protein
MSILHTTIWLAFALYLAKKVEPIIDTTFSLAWSRLVVPGIKAIVPKPTSRIRLAAEWVWYELRRTR